MIKLNTNLKAPELLGKMLDFAASRLEIGDASVTVICDARRLDKFEMGGNYRYDAALFSTPLPHTYNLFLRSESLSERCDIVFHEATHLNQYERGELKYNPLTGECYWLGRKYPASYPYRQRPWEREAFYMQRKLTKEWKKK